MMNEARESEFSQETPTICHENGVDFSAINGFTVLKLPHLPPTATSISEAAIKPLRKCSSCGLAKRRSPPPSCSSFQEPSSKRAAISTNPSSPNPSPPSSAEKNRGDTLRRSVSDFPCSPGTYQDLQNLSTSNSLNPLSTSPMPGNSKNPLAQSESQDSPVPASFPMVPQHIHRSSYPFLSDYEPVENTTPPKPPAILSPQILYQASPNSKKLRELKEKVEDLMQWMGQVAHEVDEDENSHQNNDNINYTNKEKDENQTHHDSVWVKQTDGGLILHFKCPCGEGYEVFLHGEKCYYRLT